MNNININTGASFPGPAAPRPGWLQKYFDRAVSKSLQRELNNVSLVVKHSPRSRVSLINDYLMLLATVLIIAAITLIIIRSIKELRA